MVACRHGCCSAATDRLLCLARVAAAPAFDRFAAPQPALEAYPPAADIYAFGLCVLQLVTRTEPFEEVKSEEELRKLKAEGVLPAALQTPGMDTGVRGVGGSARGVVRVLAVAPPLGGGPGVRGACVRCVVLCRVNWMCRLADAVVRC